MKDHPASQSPEPPISSMPKLDTNSPTDDDQLILWMLGLTATERLNVAQGFVDSVFALRNGRRT